MIPVDKVATSAFRQDGTVVEVENYQLDDDEQVKYDYIDAQLDDLASTFQGDMFVADIAQHLAPLKVLGAIKHEWEAGGWVVGVFGIEDGYKLIFAKPRVTGVSPQLLNASLAKRDEAAPSSEIQPSEDKTWTERDLRMPRDPKMQRPLLIRMPTRGRPGQALRVLQLYRELADTPVSIEVVIDEDDETMNCTEVLQMLCTLNCIITVDIHGSKIEAVNGGRIDDWAILALASDDMWPVVQGYDRRILDAMDRHFPLRDGLIYFNDGYNRDHVQPDNPVLCTMPIMGRRYWENFGHVYHPEYGSLFADDEQTRVAWRLNRAVFVDDMLIEHRHYAAGKAARDALYKFNDAKWGASDKALFEMRQENNFDLPEMRLSLLICSTPARRAMLDRLVDWLYHQMKLYPLAVELVVDTREGITVGEKRQALLKRAVGTYVAFIDDDDWVANNYVDRVMRALTLIDSPDCCSLVGVMTTNGQTPQRFEHSLKYEYWETLNGLLVRTPNHLNAVRRDLALQVGFVSKNVGEDFDFAMRLRPLLQSEATTGDSPLYYYWYTPGASVQACK